MENVQYEMENVACGRGSAADHFTDSRRLRQGAGTSGNAGVHRIPNEERIREGDSGQNSRGNGDEKRE